MDKKALLQVISFRAHIYLYDESGKLANMQATQELMLCEAEIPLSLVTLLRAQGLKFDNFKPEPNAPDTSRGEPA